LPGARTPAFRKRCGLKERSIAVGLQAEGEAEEAEVHFGAARYFDDKARYARQSRGTPAVVMGKATGDLSIEQPTTFELTVNLKTAKTMGFIIPQSLLLRAGGVIQ
jgi:putative ABC transport system substrate-binding protein